MVGALMKPESFPNSWVYRGTDPTIAALAAAIEGLRTLRAIPPHSAVEIIAAKRYVTALIPI